MPPSSRSDAREGADTLLAATEDGHVHALFWPWYGDTHPNEAGVGWEELPPAPGTAAALRTPEAVTASR